MHPAQPVASPEGGHQSMQPSGKRKLGAIHWSMVVMLFSAAILALLLLVFLVVGGPKGVDSAIKTDQYQAVFLDSQDGQVYFGKLDTYNREYYVLTDIYYVRVEQRIQPEGEQTTPQQSISLAKLGNELHGPEDVMYIAKNKVLFWENLKEDGQVVKAIREYQDNPEAAEQNNSSNNSTQQQSTQPAGTGNNDSDTNP